MIIGMLNMSLSLQEVFLGQQKKNKQTEISEI